MTGIRSPFGHGRALVVGADSAVKGLQTTFLNLTAINYPRLSGSHEACQEYCASRRMFLSESADEIRNHTDAVRMHRGWVVGLPPPLVDSRVNLFLMPLSSLEH